MGEASESVCRCGDVITLRSYSSSASESAWYEVWRDMTAETGFCDKDAQRDGLV